MKGFSAIAAVLIARTILLSSAVRERPREEELARSSATRTVKISNHKPGDDWYAIDTEGNKLDVHDGNMLRIGNVYYWYGMGYTDCPDPMAVIEPTGCRGIYESFGTGEDLRAVYTEGDIKDREKQKIMKRSRGACGFRVDHRINVYSSTDLITWQPHGDILPIDNRPIGVYFRPKVIFNDKTKEFILWVNVLPYASVKNRSAGKDTSLDAYPYAGFLVAKSKTPTGMFEVVTKRAHTQVVGGGDFGIMVDGADAYLAYDAWGERRVRPTGDHRVIIEKLDENFYDSLYGTEGNTSSVSSGPLSAHDHEAPAMFKRTGKHGTWYYLTYGHTCCFCKEGSNAIALRSRHPLQGWEKVSDNIMPKGVRSQQNAVFVVETASGMEYIWSGDQWKTSPDGLKSHDFQYWGRMEFDDDDKPIQPDWADEFTLELVNDAAPGSVLQNSLPLGSVEGAATERPAVRAMPTLYVPGDDGYDEFTWRRMKTLMRFGMKIAKAKIQRGAGYKPEQDHRQAHGDVD